jgi:hypothetical protein
MSSFIKPQSNTRVFRCAIPILNGGVAGMEVCDRDTLILAGGDGKVKIVRGYDVREDYLIINVEF